MIADGLQDLGEEGDLLGQRAEDSPPAQRGVLMGDLLGQVDDLPVQVGGLPVDSWSGASVDSPHPGGSCSDPEGLRYTHNPDLQLGQSRAAAEDRNQGRILSWGLQGGLRGVQQGEDRPYSVAEPEVGKGLSWNRSDMNKHTCPGGGSRLWRFWMESAICASCIKFRCSCH